MKYKKIAFIGMMGSGKSTIAHELSLKTDAAVFDCDSLFEEKYNISISDFFKKYSQEKFRICETEILKEAIKLPKFILSTGGGVILSEINREILFKGDIYTIYLSANPETIYNRIKNDDKRPLLKVENPLDE
ncbi:shikimate kinase, partial [bacterium]|nr:shikimate kinase [bacterium]